ncbi:MAG: hypothetical protein ABIE84_06635 [bacterium]
MKRIWLFILFASLLFSPIYAEEYKSLDILNETNLALYFNDFLGFVYDSHGCLHFSPSDIYLLTKTLPNKIPLRIKKYSDTSLPADLAVAPYLAEITNNRGNLEYHRQQFAAGTTEVIVYPGLSHLYIRVNKKAYAKVFALSGPEEDYLMAFNISKNEPITWDFMLTTPTDPGEYTILNSSDHYISNAYYQNTIIPFGAWLVKREGRWIFQKGKTWLKVPAHVVADIESGEGERFYNYYDLNYDNQGKVWAGRWAGHDFGRDVLLWTKDGKNRYPELGYSAGELFFEQIILIKDLVHILTQPGPDDFETLIGNNEDFGFYWELSEFVSSKGKYRPPQLNAQSIAYYKLFHNWEMTDQENALLDKRMVEAFSEYEENRLPRKGIARQKSLGLYQHLRFHSQVIDKQAYWYEKIKKDWDYWLELRVRLRKDFDKMGIRSLENRQNLLERWLTERLEFNTLVPPSQAKYVQNLSFTSLFMGDDENLVFSQRERQEMTQLLRQIISGEVEGVTLHSVDALNNYNFGVMLDEILGDLYKSHGCLHVSPRNSYFLYSLLPKKALVKIYGYDQKMNEDELAKIPYLATLVNVQADLEKLKEKFTNSQDIRIAVYPAGGLWVIYVKDQPFAKLSVKGGPQTEYYLMEGRDDDGLPIFQEHLAYPTTPGNYQIFKKHDNYISNLYYPTTVIPQGGEIRKENNRWVYQNNKGKWVEVHPVVKADLAGFPEKSQYTYYDVMVNASEEVVSLKWGSQPFGRYALQTSKDMVNPSPELIHTSGDLIMEERQLIKDLIKVMSAPFDKLEDCLGYSENFDLYSACAEFVADPSREDIIEGRERSAYRLYFGLPLTPSEEAELPLDKIAANKILKGIKISEEELKLLVKEGVAYYRGGETKINMQKILGLHFDTYQYVVTIQKYAHHYETLKKYWPELSGLRRAMLKDFNEFAIKDPKVLQSFLRELMIKRTELKQLTQSEALQLLSEIL